MKSLIRHPQTKLFLKPDGGWTCDPRQGREILCIAEAIEIAKRLEPEKVELYQAFLDELPSGLWDFGTPLPSTAGHDLAHVYPELRG